MVWVVVGVGILVILAVGAGVFAVILAKFVPRSF